MKINISGFGVVDVRSIAGTATRVIVPHYKAVFDLGENDAETRKTPHVFLSHTHTDHMAGVWQHAACRGLANHTKPIYVCPQVWKERVANLFAAAESCDDAEIPHVLIGADVASGTIIELATDLRVVPFKTFHRVPSQGYVVGRVVYKLKAEHIGKAPQELAQLKVRGIKLTETVSTLEFAYTGDTTSEVLQNTEVRQAKILVMECTYVGDKTTVAAARLGGHIHLDEIAAHAKDFENDHLILMHFSQRHTKREVLLEASKKLPADLLARTTLVIDQLPD